MEEVDRTQRVAALLKRELATLISKNLNDSRINTVTVTGVTVSKDLKQSTVYVSSIGGDSRAANIEKLLNNSAKFLRHLLSQSVDLRVTPSLTFKYDVTIQRGVEMSQLIEKLNKKTS